MLVDKTVDDALCVRVDGAEYAGEYLERELVAEPELDPKAPRAEVRHRQLAQGLG